MDQTSTTNNTTKMHPYLSPLAVWALSVGSAIGWGSLVVTSSAYLSQAGPAGSIIGLLIGFVMMLMVSSHYHFLGNRYPGVGGLYNYVKCIFGYDFAFLIAWFMFLNYIALFWGNATSIPLFARYFLQGVFKKGYLYTIFGYEVYLGEALVTLAVMWLIGLLCMKSKKATARAMVVMVIMDYQKKKYQGAFSDNPLIDHLVQAYFGSLTTILYRQWVDDGKQLPIENLIANATILICEGMHSFVKS